MLGLVFWGVSWVVLVELWVLEALSLRGQFHPVGRVISLRIAMPRWSARPVSGLSLFDLPVVEEPALAVVAAPVVEVVAPVVVDPGRRKRLKPPGVWAISEHWLRVGSFPGVMSLGRHSRDSGEPACFACGWWHEACPDGCSHRLEQAHVVPHASGGSDTDPQNFAILCQDCHVDSPDTDDVDHFWRWVAEFPENRDPMAVGFLRSRRISSAVAASFSVEQRERLGVLSASDEVVGAAVDQAGERLRPVGHFGKFSEGTMVRIFTEAYGILLANDSLASNATQR